MDWEEHNRKSREYFAKLDKEKAMVDEAKKSTYKDGVKEVFKWEGTPEEFLELSKSHNPSVLELYYCKLQEENQRLREQLQIIANTDHDEKDWSDYDANDRLDVIRSMVDTAKAALDGDGK